MLFLLLFLSMNRDEQVYDVDWGSHFSLIIFLPPLPLYVLAFYEYLRIFISPLFAAKIKYLTMTDAKKVGMPDTFFRNEKEGRFHNILVPNVYIRIFPNGDVLYSIR